MPRLDDPAAAVPAGSVAIAGGLAAVYPTASPGGWRLLGRTAARLWDPDRDPPALLAPGRASASGRWPSCRAIAVRPVPAWHPDPATHPGTPRGGSIEVVRPGPLATVQDLGPARARRTWACRVRGAADAASLRLANRLVGNPEDAAAGSS